MFKLDKLEDKLVQLEKRLRLVNKKALGFNDIMMKVDEMLENSPLALKMLFNERETEANTKFVHTFDQHNLLWSNFGEQFEVVNPRYDFKREKNTAGNEGESDLEDNSENADDENPEEKKTEEDDFEEHIDPEDLAALQKVTAEQGMPQVKNMILYVDR